MGPTAGKYVGGPYIAGNCEQPDGTGWSDMQSHLSPVALRFLDVPGMGCMTRTTC